MSASRLLTARGNPTPDRDVRLAGRVLSHRDMGKSLFADIKDSTGENPDLHQETGRWRRAV
jgi:lysyl-tRNA synthetase class II